MKNIYTVAVDGLGSPFASGNNKRISELDFRDAVRLYPLCAVELFCKLKILKSYEPKLEWEVYVPWLPGNEHLIGYFCEALRKSKRPEFLHAKHAVDLSAYQLYKLKKFDAGFALTSASDVVSVHNNSGTRGLSEVLLTKAIACGGKTLDHFDGKLSLLFGKYFPKIVKVERWNPKYAPVGWKYRQVDIAPLCGPGITNLDFFKLRADYAAGKPSVIYRSI
jgi:hypothetical protein